MLNGIDDAPDERPSQAPAVFTIVLENIASEASLSQRMWARCLSTVAVVGALYVALRGL